ncbi:hypothetical protein HanIR_Chr05g0246571 [Helianthus annuus]|nr:hypothetical protein HanIR_Chr05g0246571 [Helianthus annuus]
MVVVLYVTCPHHRFVFLQMRHAETKKGKKEIESSRERNIDAERRLAPDA